MNSSCPYLQLQNLEILKNVPVHLQHLDVSAKADIIHLVENNPTLFSDTPSRTTVFCHNIDVGDHLPIKQHACCVKPTTRSLLKKEVDYLLKNGLVVPSYSAWSSPCMLVPKSDQTPCFRTDFRKVNGIIKAV